MKIFIIILIICFIGKPLLSQNEEQSPTIPLKTKININITKKDTTTLNNYCIYYFTYKKNSDIINAGFWTAKKDTVFELGKAKVNLCRIIQLNDQTEDGEGYNLRGCAFYNGYYIYEDETLKISFDFNEYSKFPFLRLCSTD